MIVVDSSVWIDFFNGVSNPETDRLHGLVGTEPLLISDLILIEVFQGFRQQEDFDAARRLLSRLR